MRMRGVFDDRQLEPAPAKRDTELTLGSGMLLAIFFGLVLLCGLCFGLGYAIGHRGTQPLATANTQSAAGTLPAEPGGSQAKPSANTEAPQATPSASTDTDAQPPVTPSDTAPTASAETLPAPVEASTAGSQPLVHPALASTAGQSGQPVAASSAGAQPPGSLMVQIAAVSNQEDADVLTSALRKRGYAVTVRRDPADNLIHVRIGPFATAAEANSWKMKLLNDGYNAIVQQ
jgi:DedD protein